eukprot:9491755-Pyramimonas_sp.AAC.1
MQSEDSRGGSDKLHAILQGREAVRVEEPNGDTQPERERAQKTDSLPELHHHLLPGYCARRRAHPEP